jgi:hypothetical protein
MKAQRASHLPLVLVVGLSNAFLKFFEALLGTHQLISLLGIVSMGREAADACSSA